MSETPIAEAVSRHEDDLLSLPNVNGVGIGERDGRTVIKVFVTEKVAPSSLAPAELVPETLDGYEVDVEEVGVVEAQAEEP